MTFQNPDSDSTFIVIILLVATAVFLVILIAALAMLRPTGRSNNKAGRREEQKSGSLAATFARPSLQDGPKNALGAILEKLPNGIKTLNWIVCFLIASSVAGWEYYRVSSVVQHPSLLIYFILLAIISPTCLAIAWLRITGTEWRKALSLFVWVSVAFAGIWFLLTYLGFILKYVSGQCC